MEDEMFYVLSIVFFVLWIHKQQKLLKILYMLLASYFVGNFDHFQYFS